VEEKREQYLCNVSLKFTFVNINLWIRKGISNGWKYCCCCCCNRVIHFLLLNTHTHKFINSKNILSAFWYNCSCFMNEGCWIGLSDCLFAAPITENMYLLILSYFCGINCLISSTFLLCVVSHGAWMCIVFVYRTRLTNIEIYFLSISENWFIKLFSNSFIEWSGSEQQVWYMYSCFHDFILNEGWNLHAVMVFCLTWAWSSLAVVGK
jgi:hypothetical protein